MSWVPTEADHVAAHHIRIWLAEGLTASQMIEAVTGWKTCEATLDDAHHVIASAYEGLLGLQVPWTQLIPFRRAA